MPSKTFFFFFFLFGILEGNVRHWHHTVHSVQHLWWQSPQNSYCDAVFCSLIHSLTETAAATAGQSHGTSKGKSRSL